MIAAGGVDDTIQAPISKASSIINGTLKTLPGQMIEVFSLGGNSLLLLLGIIHQQQKFQVQYFLEKKLIVFIFGKKQQVKFMS